MPTESDFLAAAAMFDDAGLVISAVPGEVTMVFGSDVCIGGQLTLEIDDLLEVTRIGCRSDDRAFEAMATLCRERAAIVAGYAAALGIYNSKLQSYEWGISRWERNRSDYLNDPSTYTDPGRRPDAPVRPGRPASWVDL